MTTIVSIQQGGTGANNVADAISALGVLANTGGEFTGEVSFTGPNTSINVSNDAIISGNVVVSSNIIVDDRGLFGDGIEEHFTEKNIDESTITVAGFANTNAAAEIAVINKANGTLSYAEFIALNDKANQEQGWISIGVNSSEYNDPEYTLTGPDDGYLLFEAPLGTNANGDLIVGTGSYGQNNRIVLAAGGFAPTDAQMTIAPADLKTAVIVNSELTSNVALLTTDETHTFLANDEVIIASVGAPYDGQFTITNVSSNTISYNVTSNNIGSAAATGTATQYLPFNKGTVELTAQLFVGENAKSTFTTANLTLDNTFAIPLGVVVDNDGPGQVSMFNKSNGAFAYSEFIAQNDAADADMGWVSFGINSSNYDDPEFPITKADDAYILYEPPANTTSDGDFIIGTGTNGQKNRLIFAAQGFDEANAQMIITPDESVRISINTDATSSNTGALQVAGGVGIEGSLFVQGNQTIQGDLIVNGSQVTQSIQSVAASGPISLVGDGNIANTWDFGIVGTYAKNISSQTEGITNKELANNIATLTTANNHSFNVENYAVVTDVDSTFNGTYRITAVTSNTFSYFKLANNITSTAATGNVNVSSSATYTGVLKDTANATWKLLSNIERRPDFNANLTNAVLDSLRLATINADSILTSAGLNVTNQANNAYAQANAAYDQANTVYAQANAAYNAANNRVLKAGDTMTGNLNVAATLITQNVIPNANITYDLGASTARFKDLWLSNSTIHLGEATISAESGNISFGNATVQLSNVTSKLNVTNDLFVSGDVAVGAASSNWNSTIQAIDVGVVSSFYSQLSRTTSISTNQYIDNVFAGTTRYKVNGDAYRYEQYLGHKWYSAGEGTAGNTLTFGTPKMTLDTSGNLLVGGSSDLSPSVNSTGISINNPRTSSSGGSVLAFGIESNRAGYILADTTTNLEINSTSGYVELTTTSGRLRLTSTGNLGIGTTNPSVKLHVVGSSILANNTSIDPDSYANQIVAGAIADGSGWGVTSGIGGNAGTGDSWAIGHNGSGLYIGMGNGSAADTMQTYMIFDPNRNLYLVPNSGNVGIGSTVPRGTLDVTGGVSYFTRVGRDFILNPNYGGGNTHVQLQAGDGMQLRLASNGDIDRVTIATNGNVGIGTTNPRAGYTFDVRGNIITTGLIAFLGTNGASNWGLIRGNDSGTTIIGDAQTIHVTSSGSVGIGISSPGSRVTLGPSFATIIGLTIDTENSADSAFVARKAANKPAFGLLPWDGQVYLSAGIYYDGGSWVHHSNTNDNLLFALDPGGGVRWYASDNGGGNWNVASDLQLWNPEGQWTASVNTSTAKVIAGNGWLYGNLQLSGLLSGNSDNQYPTLKTSGSTIHFDAQGTYTGYITYNGGFTDVSDETQKKNIRSINNALDILTNLRGVRFNWKDDRDDGIDHAGFIAQEVQQYLPEAVSASGPGLLGVHSPSIVAVLVQAVKEQQTIIESLKSRIEALENK